MPTQSVHANLILLWIQNPSIDYHIFMRFARFLDCYENSPLGILIPLLIEEIFHTMNCDNSDRIFEFADIIRYIEQFASIEEQKILLVKLQSLPIKIVGE